jgi:hypothetical protein
MPRTTQTARSAAATAVLRGITKRLVAGKTYSVDGKTYSPKEIAARYQAYLDALEGLRSARAALRLAVANERKVARQLAALTVGLKTMLTVQFGTSNVVLADFGWSVPKKPGPKTVAGKVAGAAKARATRAARKTMGKRQREKVKGG